MSQADIKVDVDFARRVVVVSATRPLALSATTVEVPISAWKAVMSAILQTEAAHEMSSKALTMRAETPAAQALMPPSGVGR